MNIHELNYVLCIARHQNITKAAQELYISQPTLSKHLQKLERDLGLKLFSRVDNCYIPTHAGRRYMEYAAKVLALTQDWEHERQDLLSCNDGELNIAIPLMRSSCMIPQILPSFRRQHPNIRVNFLEETHAIQERLLDDTRIDFAIFSEGRLDPKLDSEILGFLPSPRIIPSRPGTLIFWLPEGIIPCWTGRRYQTLNLSFISRNKIQAPSHSACLKNTILNQGYLFIPATPRQRCCWPHRTRGSVLPLRLISAACHLRDRLCASHLVIMKHSPPRSWLSEEERT